MESSSQVLEPDDSLEVRLWSWWRSWGAAVIRVAFFAMVAGWFGLVGNFFLQDVLGDRNREAGMRAAVFGAMATVVFVVAVVVAWRSGWQAVVADRRDPTHSGAVRGERDRLRPRARP